MYAEGACRCGVGEVQVEVENVLTACRLHLVELLQDDVHQHVALLHGIGYLPEYRQHVFLSAQCHAVVDLSVEVYGEVANLHQRSAYVYQACHGVHDVSAFHDDTPGCGERPVKPSRHYRAAIHLGVESHYAALACHLGVGLDAERRRVAVCAYHVQPSLGNRLATYPERIYGRVVLRDEKLLPCGERSYGLPWVKTCEAVGLKGLRQIADCQEIHWRGIEKL